MSLVSLLNSEPIAGYKVTQRLGAGGYGEVWKAEAPGGLFKAIKFIYGYLTDEKAARELSALNRIKQIRHPFLLSLERIEVIDGQLIIVTELADSSLKDRYQACIDQGLTAIPREELLGYLRDAADALDFLGSNSLQHLDVKPENLLVVGGRVKVADFGLVREIQDRTCSMMGGMTPVYAAPESFDGRPNAFSDQYSLAIVFQEMLTGVVPFPGTTAAQLASQHLHSRPRLESLPDHDRTIIAKALSKQGSERFKSCRTLIDTLCAASTAAASDASTSLIDAESDADVATADPISSARMRMTPAPDRLTPQPRARRTPIRGTPSDPPTARSGPKTTAPQQQPIVDLPAVEVAADERGLRPTLFLGIGGAGGRVLRRLRRRLVDRFGDLSKLPSIGMLVVDTDCRTLSELSRGDTAHDIPEASILAMPLRKPQEYRSESLDILQWLSRRWLYNIPRSLQTEGFRPLGRLALVDHAQSFLARLEAALSEVASESAAATTEESLGKPLRDYTPRVFIVASISGGTGGGIAVEAAYIVRSFLASMGLSDAGVCNVLLHSTDRQAASKSLAIANAYSCLSELYHYAQNGYPGEPACNVPAFDRDQARMSDTYLVHLGDNLNEDDYAGAIDRVSEYLYLNAATDCGASIDKCRTQDAGDEANGVSLRTFGAYQLAGAHYELAKAAVENSCHHLVERWTSGPKKGAANNIDERANTIVERLTAELRLEVPALVSQFQAAADRALAPNRPTAIEQLARVAFLEQSAAAAKGFEDQWRYVTAYMHYMLGLGAVESHEFDAPPAVELVPAIDAGSKQVLDAYGNRFAHAVLTAVDEPELRMPGALVLVVKIVAQLRSLESELGGEHSVVEERLAASGQPPADPAHTKRGGKSAQPAVPDRATMTEMLTLHGSLLIERYATSAAIRTVRGLIHQLSSLSDTLAGMRRDLVAIINDFKAKPIATANAADPATHTADAEISRALGKELELRMAAIFAKLEKRVDREILSPRGGMARLMTGSPADVQKLPGLLRAAARVEVMDALKQIDIAGIVYGPHSELGPSRDYFRPGIQKAWPLAIKSGGDKRLFLVMPHCPSAEQLTAQVERTHEEHVNVVYDEDCDVVAVYEAQRVSLANIVSLISNDDPTCAEAARRLHTRVDVQWTAV